MSIDWPKEFFGAVTVCDTSGIILDMNDQAAAAFSKSGGRELVGRSLLDCHPEPSRTKLAGLLASAGTNIYTVEKAGVRRIICQAPWYEAGEYRGLVEIAFPLPEPMPHFVRDSKPAEA